MPFKMFSFFKEIKFKQQKNKILLHGAFLAFDI